MFQPVHVLNVLVQQSPPVGAPRLAAPRIHDYIKRRISIQSSSDGGEEISRIIGVTPVLNAKGIGFIGKGPICGNAVFGTQL